MRSPRPGVRVFPDREEVARAACAEVVRVESEALSARGAFHIALSGGTTPRKLHSLLLETPDLAPIFAAWNVWFGDERWVPHDDPESNYRMARETLLERAAIERERIHPIPTDCDTPQEAARTYAAELRAAFAPAEPKLDLCLLGMGDDGHTASLFPGSSALDAREDELVVALHLADRKAWRITLTFAAIAAARNVLFLVTGAGKAAALKRALDEDPPLLPSGRVARFANQPLWFVDEAAAADL